jgi:hypothetical protein
LIFVENFMLYWSQSLDGSSMATGPNLLNKRTAITMTMKDIRRSMPLSENQFPLFISFSNEKKANEKLIIETPYL